MCPSMTDGPYSAATRAVAETAKSLGNDRWAQMLRAWCAPFLFQGVERIFKSQENPVPAYNALLRDLNSHLRSFQSSEIGPFFTIAQGSNDVSTETSTAVEEITHRHYGNLFAGFTKDTYFNETVVLLRTRLERNGIDISNLSDKTVLDMGCGGGRYTVAWRMLGAQEAVGLDISEIGLASARERVREAGIEGVRYVDGSVLNAPFDDDSFDIAFGNGVLHHTVDWKQGVAEHVRVLKPGGLGWQYLIENPGGIFWDKIELIRVILRHVDHGYARIALRALGIPPNRIFYILDHSMVPINLRLTGNEIEAEYRKHGAKNIKRLTRGTDFDRVEAIHRNDPFAKEKFGVGENRYTFTK